MKKKLFRILTAFPLFAGRSTGVSQESCDSVQAEFDALEADYGALETQYDNTAGGVDALNAEYQQYLAETAVSVSCLRQRRRRRSRGLRWSRSKPGRKPAKPRRRPRQQRPRGWPRSRRRAAELRGNGWWRGQGGETGITFKRLSRTPDEYEGQKVKFTGWVLQVLEGTDCSSIRMSTSGRYDNVIDPPALLNVRLLEEDKIAIYGISLGLHTCETVMGGTVTLPLANIGRIEIK